MNKHLSCLIVAASLLFASAANAASGTLFMDTGGATNNSGTSDQNAANFTGTGANWTTGATTINLDTNANLTGLATDGSQAIFLTNATNSNQKIFWITGVTGCTGSGACSVTISVAANCTTCTAQVWNIGGRMILTPANYEAALRPGDTVQFNNSPASSTSTVVTARVAGDTTTGFVNYVGKTGGTRPQLTTSNASSCFNGGNLSYIRVYFLACQVGGAAQGFTQITSGSVIDSVVINGNSLGTTGISITSSSTVTSSEISGFTGDGISTGGTGLIISGNYIHGNGGNGITSSGANSLQSITDNLITSNTGRGIYFSSASGGVNRSHIEHNTIYGNTAAQFEVVASATGVSLRNNIIMTTGAGNIATWDAGSADIGSQHWYNVYYSSSTGTLSGLTPNSTESNGVNPNFVNGAGGNFLVQTGSPAAGKGWPQTMPDSSTTGAPDIGAFQRAVGASGNYIIGGS